MEKFFDNDLMKIIVDQTNSYAAKFLERCPQLKTNSRLKKWFPTTVNEMRCFIALLVLQGIIKKPTIQMYFSKRETISTPFFRKVMNINRFILLCKFIHFEDNERSDCLNPVNKLAKIQTVFENIKEKCKNLYLPKQDICVDESLLLWKGRLSWKQYIPSKRSRFGMKFFVLCESDSGYIWNFLLYTGKDTNYGSHYSEYNISSRIVLELSHEILDLGYRIHVDNWYTNIKLAEKLCVHHTDLVGTMRKNKVGIPLEIINSSLNKGEQIERYKNKLMIMKWRDKKDILMLSTIHDGSMIEIKKNNKIKRKPSVVYDYNKKMGGVDNSDAIIVAYSMARKRLKKYYKKIFLHLLDIICMNSYLIYKKFNGKLNRIDFLLEYIEKTIELYSDDSSNTSQLGRPASTTPLRLLGKHFPDLVPSTKAKSNPTRRCSYCSKNNIRRESRYWCPICKVALCAAPCFKNYHCP